MFNELDELTGPVNDGGRDVNVIEKQIHPKTGFGTTIFIIILFILGILPGIIFIYKKMRAYEYLQKLQQKIQHNASQIDNYIEQRVVILQNAAALVEKATTLDKDVMTQVAAFRGGARPTTDAERNQTSERLDTAFNAINVAFERYPELRSMEVLQKAMQDNVYLQQEITAAREIYNDVVNRWNTEIFIWPCNRYVASKNNYSTRIPFSTSKEMKQKARENFFK